MTVTARPVALRAPYSAPRRPLSTRAVGPVVGCPFCREPIEIGSFALGPPDPTILSAACPNCGLLVSATPATLATWSRQDLAAHRENDIADRRRAYRVAMGTRAILDRVCVTEPFEERAV